MRMSCPSCFVGAAVPDSRADCKQTVGVTIPALAYRSYWIELFRQRRRLSEGLTMVLRERIATGISLALGSALFFLLGAVARAQDAGNYPNRPVMMIVPFAPGGASDFVARIIQHGVSDILSQQIVFDNRPGAAGFFRRHTPGQVGPRASASSFSGLSPT